MEAPAAEPSAGPPSTGEVSSPSPAHWSSSGRAAAAQAPDPVACPMCASVHPAVQDPPSCVYVIGHIEPRFPLLSIEKEVRQAVARASATKETDREVMARLLREPANKYLVRRLCWVLSVQGVETYILFPRDGDYQPLVDAYRADPHPGDLELVIGARGPIASAEVCNGLLVPIVIFDQIYAFDRVALLQSIPKPKEGGEKFLKACAEVFDRITLQIDNSGATDAHRACNYLSVRYERIYSLAAEQFNNNASLTAVEVLPSPLSGTRKIVDVVFSFTDRTTDVVSRFFTRVDVTECFPFLVTKMSPYYHR